MIRISWYFTRGVVTVITAPLFVLLAYCFVVSALGAALQALALLQVTGAVWGFIGVLPVVLFGWIAVILPPVLYYSLLSNLPFLWIRPDGPGWMKVLVSSAVLIFFPIAAHSISSGVSWGISWIADHDPCAAFAAGVTGSVPCLTFTRPAA